MGTPYLLFKTHQNLWIMGIYHDLISTKISEDKCYEADTTDFLIKNIRPSETIIEIGANIGYYTTLMAKLVGEKGKIYSYEANDEVYQLAVLSLKMNDLSDRVKIKNVAVSDKNEEVKLERITIEQSQKETFSNIGRACITKNNLNQQDGRIIVPAVTLDTDLPELKNVDWLRMDIEGSEILALEGAKRIIESSPNLKIVMEWVPSMMSKYGNVEKLIDTMHSYGFKFYDIAQSGKLGKEFNKKELLEKTGFDNVVLIR